MAYEFRWYDDAQGILVVDIAGETTWGDYDIVHKEICALLETTPHRIDVIFNDRVGLPSGNPMPHLKKVISKLISYDKMGLVYAVNDQNMSSLMRVMIDMAISIYRIDRAHYGGFTQTVDEAVALIQKDRASSSKLSDTSL
jgi:hypothetical protein